jgi:hypothetical protein
MVGSVLISAGAMVVQCPHHGTQFPFGWFPSQGLLLHERLAKAAG